MAYEVRLATTITETVDRRLRMYALIKRQPLSHILSVLLDQALPPAEELAGQLVETGDAETIRLGMSGSAPQHVRDRVQVAS